MIQRQATYQSFLPFFDFLIYLGFISIIWITIREKQDDVSSLRTLTQSKTCIKIKLLTTAVLDYWNETSDLHPVYTVIIS